MDYVHCTTITSTNLCNICSTRVSVSGVRKLKVKRAGKQVLEELVIGTPRLDNREGGEVPRVLISASRRSLLRLLKS